MRIGVTLLAGLTITIFGASCASAQNINLSDTARLLAPGGNTIGGPGVFNFGANQGNNVVDLSSVPDSVCASILLISGTADVILLDAAGVSIEASGAVATQGSPGGITAGATACASNVGLVEVKCSGTSTEPCKGAWRVDKK